MSDESEIGIEDIRVRLHLRLKDSLTIEEYYDSIRWDEDSLERTLEEVLDRPLSTLKIGDLYRPSSYGSTRLGVEEVRRILYPEKED